MSSRDVGFSPSISSRSSESDSSIETAQASYHYHIAIFMTYIHSLAHCRRYTTNFCVVCDFKDHGAGGGRLQLLVTRTCIYVRAEVSQACTLIVLVSYHTNDSLQFTQSCGFTDSFTVCISLPDSVASKEYRTSCGTTIYIKVITTYMYMYILELWERPIRIIKSMQSFPLHITKCLLVTYRNKRS